MDNIKTENLLNLEETIAKDFFQDVTYPWSVLPRLGELITTLGHRLAEEEYDRIGSNIWISKSASVAQTAFIEGPTIIDHDATVRHCAYIRGNVILGKSAIVGNSCELKNAVLFNEVQVPHFSYVGDSILGYKAHIGAGGITSNQKSDKSIISLNINGEYLDTSLRKFGTILGDHVEVGCNAVMNPGSIVGRGTIIYPLSMVRGFIPPTSIYKKQGEVIKRR